MIFNVPLFCSSSTNFADILTLKNKSKFTNSTTENLNYVKQSYLISCAIFNKRVFVKKVNSFIVQILAQKFPEFKKVLSSLNSFENMNCLQKISKNKIRKCENFEGDFVKVVGNFLKML